MGTTIAMSVSASARSQKLSGLILKTCHGNSMVITPPPSDDPPAFLRIEYDSFVCFNTRMPKLFVLSFSLTVLTGFGVGQTPTVSPPPKTQTGRDTITVTRQASLDDELVRSEVEPRLKRFQMNIRFLRGKYSKPATGNGKITHVYIWDYFTEAIVALQYIEPAAGKVFNGSEDPEQLITKALQSAMQAADAEKLSEKGVKIGDLSGKQIEVRASGKKLIARAFVRGNDVFLLLAQLRTDNAAAKVEKLFDSFSFVVEGP